MRLCTLAAAVLLTMGGAVSSASQQIPETSAALEARAREAEGASRTQEAFDLYIQALKTMAKDENDFAVRERIISLSLTLGSVPPLPEDAERLFIRAQTMVADARNDDDLDTASAEMQQAIRAAPWSPALAYNLALIREQQQYYGAAANNLKVYLLSNPEDAEHVRRKMYGLEAKGDRDELARTREECALNLRDRNACLRLAIAAGKLAYPEEYAANDFACRKRQRFCGELAQMVLRAAAAERFPANVVAEVINQAQALRTAGVTVDPDRVPALVVTACRDTPEHCVVHLLLMFKVAEVEKAAVKGGRSRTGGGGVGAIVDYVQSVRPASSGWVDALWGRIGLELYCNASRPADCLAKGILAQWGLGQKENKTEAKRLFQEGCNGGLAVACEARQKLGR